MTTKQEGSFPLACVAPYSMDTDAPHTLPPPPLRQRMVRIRIARVSPSSREGRVCLDRRLDLGRRCIRRGGSRGV
ncbi:hypothetical protein BC829DRAFT_394455, partial [Chytridium lagenaria]